MEQLLLTLHNAGFALAILWLAFMAKKVDDFRTGAFDDDAEIGKGNLALGIRRSGLYLGGIVAATGTLAGSSTGFVNDLMSVLFFGGLSYVLLFSARHLCDKYLLPTIDNDDACLQGNVGVGLVEFGILMATGIILNGSLAGDDTGISGTISTLVFFVLGQAVLMMTMVLYQKITPYDDQQKLKDGFHTVGILCAGKLIAIALIVRASLVGPTTEMFADIINFLMSAIAGIVLIFAFNYVMQLAFLPKMKLNQKIEEKNMAVALIMSALTIGLGFIISCSV